MNVSPPGLASLVLRTFPADDAAFARAVAESAAHLDVLDPAWIERDLRTRFPRAAVRPSEIHETWTVWYVYRDGHWTAAARRPATARPDARART